MSSTLDRLVYMANQIAIEFGNQMPNEAVEATYDHLWHFWDPRTREMIIAHHEAGGAGLSETANAAIERLATARGKPAPVTRGTEFSGDGGRMSDAG